MEYPFYLLSGASIGREAFAGFNIQWVQGQGKRNCLQQYKIEIPGLCTPLLNLKSLWYNKSVIAWHEPAEFLSFRLLFESIEWVCGEMFA